jgi:hypothetical protein
MGVAPLHETPVVTGSEILVEQATWSADDQRPDMTLDCEVDHLPCCLMMALMDSTAVTAFRLSLSPTIGAPPPRPSDPWLRRFGSRPPSSTLRVGQMQARLGPQRPTGYQEPLVVNRDRIRVDDPKVNPGHLAGTGMPIFHGEGS